MMSLVRFLALPILVSFVACAHPKTTATPAPAPVRTTAAVPGNEVSDLARREILRRQERIQAADRAALESHQRMADGDLEGAVSGYREAARAVGAP